MKIKLKRKTKRKLLAAVVMALFAAMMILMGVVAVVGGIVIILSDGLASAIAIITTFIAFIVAIGLGNLIGCLINIHFRRN